MSAVPGTLGGYRPGKIYGRLDCPSALRWIAKGHYVNHRVFFADEATAIAAGYQPCSRCMPEKQREWERTPTPQPHAPAAPGRAKSLTGNDHWGGGERA
nr:Ada metal-binding domain-containing protein [Geodermatophilus normandii]